MYQISNEKISPDQSRYQKELAASFRDDTFNLILLPTEHCNFRCTYCYEDYAIGRMSAETILGVKRLIDRRVGGLRTLIISWFGGEPLLARTIIEDISEHIVHAVSCNPDLYYKAYMTTNGYLLSAPVLERLAALGVSSFQISLDGPELVHDRTRVRANGRGSFREIWDNLIAIRDGAVSVEVLLRIHLTPENLPSMPEFLAEIRETFLHDARFTTLLRPVEHLGGPNDATMQVIPEVDRPKTLAELEAIVLAGVSSEAVLTPTEICYASRANSLVVRADGRVGKCTVALADPRNTIGKLLPDGSLEIDNARLRLWLHGWTSTDWVDLECPLGKLGQLPPQHNDTDALAASAT
jgi:uncharacterized protein